MYIPRVNSGSSPQGLMARLDLALMSYDRLSAPVDQVLIIYDCYPSGLIGGFKGTYGARTLSAIYMFSYNAKDE